MENPQLFMGNLGMATGTESLAAAVLIMGLLRFPCLEPAQPTPAGWHSQFPKRKRFRVRLGQGKYPTVLGTVVPCNQRYEAQESAIYKVPLKSTTRIWECISKWLCAKIAHDSLGFGNGTGVPSNDFKACRTISATGSVICGDMLSQESVNVWFFQPHKLNGQTVQLW